MDLGRLIGVCCASPFSLRNCLTRLFICEIAILASHCPVKKKITAQDVRRKETASPSSVSTSLFTLIKTPFIFKIHQLLSIFNSSIFVPGRSAGGFLIPLKPQLNPTPGKGQPGSAFIFKPVENQWDVAFNFSNIVQRNLL